MRHQQRPTPGGPSPGTLLAVALAAFLLVASTGCQEPETPAERWCQVQDACYDQDPSRRPEWQTHETCVKLFAYLPEQYSRPECMERFTEAIVCPFMTGGTEPCPGPNQEEWVTE